MKILRIMLQCTALLGLVVLLSGCVAVESQQAQSGDVPQLNLRTLTEEQAEQRFIPGRTQQHQVRQWLGIPHGYSRSGDLEYWNYTDSYHDESLGQSGLISLTLVFDRNALLVDFDLQANRYRSR
ncbi:MAG: hypothetical protein JJU10_12510 [Idiomarina sp.]|nr:hypothetical protein [Idiomarina sp.]